MTGSGGATNPPIEVPAVHTVDVSVDTGDDGVASVIDDNGIDVHKDNLVRDEASKDTAAAAVDEMNENGDGQRNPLDDSNDVKLQEKIEL